MIIAHCFAVPFMNTSFLPVGYIDAKGNKVVRLNDSSITDQQNSKTESDPLPDIVVSSLTNRRAVRHFRLHSRPKHKRHLHLCCRNYDDVYLNQRDKVSRGGTGSVPKTSNSAPDFPSLVNIWISNTISLSCEFMKQLVAKLFREVKKTTMALPFETSPMSGEALIPSGEMADVYQDCGKLLRDFATQFNEECLFKKSRTRILRFKLRKILGNSINKFRDGEKSLIELFC